ncbi:30S ribosomal protein S6 [Catenisphaera adipataccumulans]|jgi:small subunit ribosomal protein S6|uniref:Small ribosomal subunit protein bS6 n=1 Tax=Catenisphaera adipataccumulans TaxID=700500 RepID=A0A7W8FUB3_9FIRM|nr:30S ribosomal protein S6 [Catenisphaera adipataccumulans]MBB5182409.1 small subunit ribosomal protein S6 [Catenisphaera adipataccumulans]
MKKYEIMYIVKASLDDDQFQKVADRLNSTITENGGTIDKFDDWGVKDFAYEIDHMKKGHYAVINATANNAGVAEFQRMAHISNNVIRIMVLKTEDEKK